MPTVELIDLRRTEVLTEAPFLSVDLADALRATVKAGRQAIVYHNRRGHSPFQLCLDCGSVPTCRDCAASLTFHRGSADRAGSDGHLVCHLCGAQLPRARTCPVCASARVELRGLGTERVEEALEDLLPTASVLRFDTDAMRAKGAVARALADFRQGRHAVLVGTQMVTKGHDFPNVHLVGVLLAEHGLAFPDFRAAEHTVQRLVQVAGRAGRSTERGRVLVQTYASDHYAFACLERHDYVGFARVEAELRSERAWPPAARLVLLELRGPNALLVEHDLARLRTALESWRTRTSSPIRVRGPTPAPLKRVRAQARFHLLVSAASRPPLQRLLREMGTWPDAPPGLIVDVDPLDLM